MPNLLLCVLRVGAHVCACVGGGGLTAVTEGSLGHSKPWTGVGAWMPAGRGLSAVLCDLDSCPQASTLSPASPLGQFRPVCPDPPPLPGGPTD